ncbi:MAG: DUF6268 family outer membrane beta-barrel protein [Planctomycetota bacterium]|nr:DUF6268 family outer membrane beta-barrel protein [Planctomycetota bacterium]
MRTPMLAIACVPSLILPALCAAQPLDDALAKVSFSLRSRASFATETDLDTTGTVSVARLGPTLSARYAENETWFVDVAVGAEFSFYDFEGATGIVSTGDPAGDFAKYFLNARYTAQANDNWWWFVGGEASWAGEDSENLGDGFIGRASVGATYAVNDTLRIGLGVAVRSRLEDDPIVYPLPIIHWQISEQWTLATADDGLRLSYKAWDDWTFFASAGWEAREYRLNDTGPIPEGVMRDDRIPVMLGAIWTPGEHFEIEATVGAAAWSRYEFLDSTGATIAEPDGDAALMAGLSARVRF